MKPFKSFKSQNTTYNKEYKIVTNGRLCEPYWEEGIKFYGKTDLFKYQIRMYKSWKHNRKTQYK